MVSYQTARLFLSLDVIFIGIGGGLVIVTLMIAAQHGVPRNLLGVTTSTDQFARNIGASIGTAAMGAIMRARLQNQSTTVSLDLPRFITENDLAMIVRPEMRSQLSETTMSYLRGSLADALHGAFIFVFVVVIIGAVIAFFVPRGFAHELAHKSTSYDAQADEAAVIHQEEALVVGPEAEPAKSFKSLVKSRIEESLEKS